MARLRRRTRLLLSAVALLIVTGVVLAVWDFDSPIKIERDRQPAWKLDPNHPYEISVREGFMPMGGGSDFVIHQDGRVVAKRDRYVSAEPQGYRKTETTTFTIPPDARASILDAIQSNHVMDLHRSYELKNTFDGHGWAVVIKQGEREKIVGCRNYFPDEARRFKQQVQAILSRYTSELKWQEVKRSE